MKKIFLFATVALLAVACSKDENVAPGGKEPVETNTPGTSTEEETPNTPQNDVRLVEKTFTTSTSNSKTAVYGFESQVDVGFHDDDTIQVFDASGNYVIRPTGVNMQKGGEVNGQMIYKKMNFKGEVPEGDGKLGFVYPFKQNYTFSGTTVTNVNIPTTQNIPAGTYDPSAIFFYAYTSDVQVVMQNPCALVMITFDENCGDYDQIQLTRNVSVGGTGSLDVETGVFNANNATIITIKPYGGTYFQKGATYFVVIQPGKGTFVPKIQKTDENGSYWGELTPKKLLGEIDFQKYSRYFALEYTFNAGKCYRMVIGNGTYELVSGN